MLLERDYSNADPRKSLPPIPLRVSRRSQLIAALRQNERPIVIEDQGLAGQFVRLLRVRELGKLGEFVANTMSSGIDQSYGANVEALLVRGPICSARERAKGERKSCLENCTAPAPR